MRGSRVRVLGGALLVLGVLLAAILLIVRISGFTFSGGPAALNSVVEGEQLPPIVFARQGNIWRSHGNGAPLQQLTRLEASSFAINPSVSPDGQQIAYAVVEQPNVEAAQLIPTSKLYLVNSDGSNVRPVWDTPQGLINNVSWTPDGKLLYVGITGLRAAPAEIGGMQLSEIVIVDVATGEVRPFIEDAIHPVIDREGKWIAYIAVSDSGGPQAAVTMSLQLTTLDASDVRVVIEDSTFISLYAPRFSPDGTRLVFAAAGGPNSSAAPTTYSGPQPPVGLLERLLAALTPAARAHGQPYDLWTINVDGTGLQRLAQVNEDEPMAVFVANGKELVMMASGGIYRMNADGSNLRLVDTVGGHGGLDWLAQ